MVTSKSKRLKQLCLFTISVLETEKSLVLAEKGSGDNDDVELIRAAAGFRLVATMNPGGDFGKKEVCNPSSTSRTDSLLTLHHITSDFPTPACQMLKTLQNAPC